MPTTEGLLRLMMWLSPSFPVGAYTYSHGVEYAYEAGHIKTAETLKTWCEGVLQYGTAQNDGLIFCRAWDLAHAKNINELCVLNEFASNLQATSELSLEAHSQGRSFLSTITSLHNTDMIIELNKAFQESHKHPVYSVIVGALCGFEGIEKKDALGAFLHAFIANLISAAVRLVPLGQTQGQACLLALEPMIIAECEKLYASDIADIGSCAPMVDWTSMKHETQYTRLFRS